MKTKTDLHAKLFFATWQGDIEEQIKVQRAIVRRNKKTARIIKKNIKTKQR